MNSVLNSLAGLSLGRMPAEDGRVEALQDLDLFYIKQLAHGLKVRRQLSAVGAHGTVKSALVGCWNCKVRPGSVLEHSKQEYWPWSGVGLER